MEKRYFLALVHSDQRNDKMLSYGSDVGKANSELAEMIQKGAPAGCRLGILFSTKKLIKIQRLYSAEELAASVDQLNSRDEGRQSEISEQTRDILDRFKAIKTEADNLGVTLPNAQLILMQGEQGQDLSKSALDAVDPESILGEFLALQERAAAAGVTLPVVFESTTPENLDAPLAGDQNQPATGGALDASNQAPRVVNPIPSLVPPKAKDGAGKAKSDSPKAKDGAGKAKSDSPKAKDGTEAGNLLEST